LTHVPRSGEQPRVRTGRDLAEVLTGPQVGVGYGSSLIPKHRTTEFFRIIAPLLPAIFDAMRPFYDEPVFDALAMAAEVLYNTGLWMHAYAAIKLAFNLHTVADYSVLLWPFPPGCLDAGVTTFLDREADGPNFVDFTAYSYCGDDMVATRLLLKPRSHMVLVTPAPGTLPEDATPKPVSRGPPPTQPTLPALDAITSSSDETDADLTPRDIGLDQLPNLYPKLASESVKAATIFSMLSNPSYDTIRIVLTASPHMHIPDSTPLYTLLYNPPNGRPEYDPDKKILVITTDTGIRHQYHIHEHATDTHATLLITPHPQNPTPNTVPTLIQQEHNNTKHKTK